MHVLKAFPIVDKEAIPLQPFILNARDTFEKLLLKVKKHFGNKNDNHSDVIADWEAWDESVVPQTDNPNDYVVRYVCCLIS